ncbi:MAG: hypothetical protein HQL47_05635 [Gammaproteobacteria bacterium]|nr:hypothetical protein [Gammaproteobacteria bacterium]
MKILSRLVFFVTGFAFTGLAAAAPVELVSQASMDRIFASASQEVRLAEVYDRHHRPNRPSQRPSHRPEKKDKHNWVGPVVAGALIGAIIANSNSSKSNNNYSYSYTEPKPYYNQHNHYNQHGQRKGYRSAKRQCAAEFRSYDWDSDTIVNRKGRVKLCPYVRPYVRY